MTDTDPTTSDSELAVLRCEACGAPVALTDAHVASCGHCEATVPVPAEHRARHAELAGARTDRVRAEQLLDTLPKPLPGWVAMLGPWLVALGLPVWIVVAIVGWVFWGWFPSPLHMLGWGIFTPIFVTIFVLIDVMAARSHSLGIASVMAVHEEGGWLCRQCGATLSLEIDALAATCDYCGSDSLLRDAGPFFRRALARERQAASRSLGVVLGSLRERRREHRSLRITLAAVLIPCWLFFVGPLLWISFGG